MMSSIELAERISDAHTALRHDLVSGRSRQLGSFEKVTDVMVIDAFGPDVMSHVSAFCRRHASEIEASAQVASRPMGRMAQIGLVWPDGRGVGVPQP